MSKLRLARFVARSTFLLAAMAPCAGAQGATFRPEGSSLVVSGEIREADVPLFSQLLDRQPAPRSVVFEHCLGGTLGAAYDFMAAIRARHLDTVARRQCSSACALAFLAGQQRSFDESFGVSVVGLHGPRAKDSSGPSGERVGEQMMDTILEMTGGKMQPAIADLIAGSWKASAGVFFIHANFWLFRSSETRYCDGTEEKPGKDCRRLEGVDALSQGIVTR